MQSDAKQDNFVSIDSCSHYKEIEHVTSFCPKKKLFTLIDPKFDGRELVNNKEDALNCENKCVILEEHKLKGDVISLPCFIQEKGCNGMPLVENIKHEEHNKHIVMVLNSLLEEKCIFYELSYVIDHEKYFGK